MKEESLLSAPDKDQKTKKNIIKASLISLAVLIILAGIGVLLYFFVFKSQYEYPFLDPNLPISQRVDDLVSRLTLEEKANQMIDAASAIDRLKIHKYSWRNEGLHGVARAGIATVFPQAIGLAATWNEQLIFETAEIISTEFRAK